MEPRSFAALTADLETELRRLGYTDGSIRQYHQVWRRIGRFLEQQGSACFTEQLGVQFLETRCDYLALEAAGALTQSQVNIGRVVRMLGDFQQHRTVLRRYYKQRNLLQTEAFQETLAGYVRDCEQREHSPVTRTHYRKITEKFLSFAESQAIIDCDQLTAQHCSAYVETWLGYQAKTVELQLCGLRSFLRYLHATGQHGTDLAAQLPTVRVTKQARIPSAWTAEQVTQILKAVDRGNPAGKRDYAMILLAARLGPRSMDIKHLQLQHLHWAERRIEFVASKTGQRLSLPLLPDVGWAIIDYLQHGRPAVDSPYVFLRHLAPIVPFADDDHLHQIIEKYRQLAHVSLPPKRRRGFHALRHTLASVLLDQGTPLSVIADVLGHADPESTGVYLKIDVSRLRECAGDPDQVLDQ